MSPTFVPRALLPALASALLLGLAACAGPGPADAPAPPDAEAEAQPEPRPRLYAPYRALDPEAPPVTEATILENERFWPYRVRVLEAWPAPGLERPISKNRAGVLVRVEASGHPRIDFGSLGKYEVPIQQTDLVAQSNKVRRGELDKWGPNFVHAIQSRLIDSRPEQPTRLDPGEVAGYRAYLCVFADPLDPAFPELVAALAPLEARHGAEVLTLFFPQDRLGRPDAEVFDVLVRLDWRVPFVFGFLSDGYTRSLLVDPSRMPALMLQSPEGRLLFDDGFSVEATAELARVLERSFL